MKKVEILPNGMAAQQTEPCPYCGPVCGQDIAPIGWWCSRPAGHEGPCAAHEKVETDPLVIAEGALRTARHAILRQADTFKAEQEITTALWHIRCALRGAAEEDADQRRRDAITLWWERMSIRAFIARIREQSQP